MKSYRELVVWQKAINLSASIYEIMKQLPRIEVYGLSSQINRAAVSIASNIAEGYQRNGTKEYLRFLGIAQGSTAELDTQLEIIERVYSDIKVDIIRAQIIEIQKMLTVLIQKLKEV